MRSQWEHVQPKLEQFFHWLFFGHVNLQPWAVVMLFVVAIWFALARDDSE